MEACGQDLLKQPAPEDAASFFAQDWHLWYVDDHHQELFLFARFGKNMSHVWCLSIWIDASMYVCFLRFLTRAIQKYSIRILWFFIWWVGRSSTNFPTAKLFWFFIRKGSIKKWRFWFYQMIGSLFDLGLPACVWGIPGFKFDVVPLNDVCWNFRKHD